MIKMTITIIVTSWRPAEAVPRRRQLHRAPHPTPNPCHLPAALPALPSIAITMRARRAIDAVLPAAQ